MKNYIFIKQEFIKEHQIIDSNEYMDKYINFLLNYKLNITEENTYTEKHHILPNCSFPQYYNEIWNIIELTYDDHKLVHLWLFKAINIRCYQRPLNFMMKDYKNKQELSNASKRGWVNLKNDEEKYKKWVIGRSNHMKSLSTEEQSRRANIYWKNISDEEYIEYCNNAKSLWTEERRNKQSEKLLKYYSNPENIEKSSNISKNIWDNKSIEDRTKFNETMNIVNKDENKRKIAGDKIKQLWLNEDYLQKMKNRKSRVGKSITLIRPDNIYEIFETMEHMIKKYNFSAHFIRKYKDTNNKIIKEHLKIENIHLLNCIIETTK